MTFQTRAISKLFNESKHLAIGIYAFGSTLAIIVPITEITNDVDAKYLISCLGIIFSTITAVLALWVPKFFIIWMNKDKLYHPLTQPVGSLFSGTGSSRRQAPTDSSTGSVHQ